MPPMPNQTDDLYDDSPSAPPESAKDKKSEGEPTALLDKSVLGGKEFNVGEEVVLKIVAMHDNEVEVEYAPEKPESKDKGGEMKSMQPEPTMAQSMDSNYD